MIAKFNSTDIGTKGSSLLEIIIAMGILGICSVTIISLFHTSFSSNIDSSRKAAAMHLAKQGIEDVRKTYVSGSTYFEDDITLDTVSYKRIIDTTVVSPGVFNVRSRVYWKNWVGQDRWVAVDMQRTP